MDVVVVGSVNADLRIEIDRLPGPGETRTARDGGFSPGGKGANQALAARLCGADVAMVGAVGRDVQADAALALLREHEVDLAHLVETDAPTGTAVVMVEDTGENSIAVVPGANACVGRGAVREAADAISRAVVLVVQGEIPAEGIEAAAEIAGPRLVLNLAPVHPVDPAVIRRADPLVVNEHEAQLVLELLADGAAVESGRFEALVEALEDAGCTSVVLTLGADGALVRRAGRTSSVPATPAHAVDTTGAGDAFVGCLAAALADGADLVDAAARAARYAATTVERPGAQASYRAESA